MSMATSNSKAEGSTSPSKSSFVKLFGSKSNVQSAAQIEDIVTAVRSNKEDEQFDIILAELEDTLMDDHFVQLQNRFFEKYAHVFTEDEENKLEYTSIFNEYTKTIEDYLTRRLSASLPWFNMTSFLNMIKARPDQAEGDVFDMLRGLGDFSEFKDLILSFKRESEGTQVDLSGLLAVTSSRQN